MIKLVGKWISGTENKNINHRVGLIVDYDEVISKQTIIGFERERKQINHELIELFVIDDAVSEARVLINDSLRLLKLRVDPWKLVNGRGDPQARDVS